MKRAWALAALVAACGAKTNDTLPPLGQLLLSLETDAPLPPPPGDALLPDDAPPLFDRIRIEVFRPGESTACDGCTHEFDVDRGLVAAGRASVGLTTPPGALGYVARVRLYRAAFVHAGQPRADATIDRYVALPPTSAEGITSVTAALLTDDVAHTVGSLASPVPAELRPPNTALGWPYAKRASCIDTARDGEVCVPGGAFWMGNPLMEQARENGDVVRLHLVSLAPFFLDATEVTVAAFRRSGLAATRDPMLLHDGDNQPDAPLRCSYTAMPENDEELPVNCLSWQKARAYCQARGGDLPTEAQLEYAAGGLASHLFPWGDDAPACADAVFNRSPFLTPEEQRCPGGWLERPGSGSRDRLVLEGGTIVDLAGNVIEYALDTWAFASGPCWPLGVLHDPVCAGPTDDPTAPPGAHTAKHGSWAINGEALAAPFREPTASFAQAQQSGPSGGTFSVAVTSTGFRCARSGG